MLQRKVLLALIRSDFFAVALSQALFWSSPYNRAKVESRDWFSLNEAALQAEASEFVTQFIRQNSSSLVEQIGIQAWADATDRNWFLVFVRDTCVLATTAVGLKCNLNDFLVCGG